MKKINVEKVLEALALCRYDPDPGQEPKFTHSCQKCPYYGEVSRCAMMFNDAIALIRERSWIPFRVRELTEEEKQMHPDWLFMYDCQIPEVNQEILISVLGAKYEHVQTDVWTEFGLDGCWTIPDEAVAWMPMPEEYKEEKHEQ